MAIPKNRKPDQSPKPKTLEDYTSATGGTTPNRATAGPNRGDYWKKVEQDLIRQGKAIEAGKGHPQPQNKLSPAKAENTQMKTKAVKSTAINRKKK
jgi:hypothetical protein